MKEFKNLTCNELHTFHSEKIGAVFYYLCTMEIDGRTIHFTIHFDCDDLYDSLDEDKDAWDDDDLECYSLDLALCTAEMIASNEDYVSIANETIKHYNNGAYDKVKLNK